MIFSKQKLLIAGIIVTGIIFIGVLIFVFFGPKQAQQGPPVPPAKIEVWGAFDDSDVINPMLRDFHDRYGHLEATYKKLSIEEYEQALTDAQVAGKGPDVYMINNTWIPRYMTRIHPASPQAFDAKAFRDAFVDGTYEDLVGGGSVYGIPLHMDSLGLFYNKDYFSSAGIALPPATWEDFLADVRLLTKRDAKGNISRAGVSMGTSSNVNRSFDILTLLMMQQGAEMISKDGMRASFDSPLVIGSSNESFYPGERALTFYTDFANPRKLVYTWNTLQHFSLDAFIAGETAMMINYSRVIPLIEARAPYLKWGVAPMPQISARDVDVNFGNYWVLVVSATSKVKEQAWTLLKFAGDRDNAKLYADNARRPVARRDLVDIQRNDEKLGIFAVQSLSAKSWRQVDNLKIEELFMNMIESVVKGADSARDAVVKAAKQVNVLMRKQ